MARAQLRSADGLDAVLSRARQDSAEFPVLLANHAPMVLVGLDRLGAPADRLVQFFETYRDANGLVPVLPPVARLDRETWTGALGQRSREADTRAFFAREMSGRGMAEVLGFALPVLLPGVGASALHALMRLAYAVMRQDPEEAAVALGYWTVTYLPLPPTTGAAPDTDDPAEVLARVAALPHLRDVVPETDLLWHNIRAVAWTPAFAPAVDWLRIDGTTQGRIAAVSLKLFAGTMDFAALHAVTGSHWVRLLAPHCEAPQDLVRSFWQVIAALVPKIGFPSLPDEVTLARWRHAPCPDWPAIMAKAAQSDDEHDISLVFSAHEEDRFYGDRLYRVVAARRMGMIE